MDKPSLQDDELALRQYSQDLRAAVESVIGSWIRRSIAGFDPELADSPDADAAVIAGSQSIVTDLGELLARDIDEQTVGPLQILRGGTRFAVDVLRAAGVPPVARDEFAERAFPDDVYNLSPASFADVDASLHEPGLVWGAAKAHVHLRRRRSTGDL